MLYDLKWNLGEHMSPSWRCPITVTFNDGVISFEADFDKEHVILPMCEPLEPGIFGATLNLNNHIEPPFCNAKIDKKNMYPCWARYEVSDYGVADNLDQIKEYFSAAIADPNRQYILALTEMHKSDQPEYGGWRWHKWGPYIGVQSPQHEYLYDEPDIDMVIIFHLYSVIPVE